MSGNGSRTRQIRIAAAILAALLVGATVLTFLAYTAALTPTDTVTVMSPRAGLVLDRDAKVKYRGVQIGKLADIAYADDQAKLTLAINSSQLDYVPANVVVHIGSTTIFGAKSVEFLAPAQPLKTSLRPGAVLRAQAGAVQLEVNTLFQTLMDLLNKIDPVHLNAVLTAVSEGLRGHGDDLGTLLAGANRYAALLNPKYDTLRSDFAKAARVANTLADAAPDLVTVIDNAPAISRTIIDQQDNLNATLLAAIGLANAGRDTLAPAEQDFIAAIQRVRAPLKVLGDYSPEFGCLFQAIASSVKTFGPLIGGTRPGLFVSSSFIPGVPAYTYPESLPIVNASGGPNCRGLPHLPTKQNGGVWWHPPFLVTDNAYIPFQPNTELQFDAPSVVQFLFNGAYAERDDF